MLADGEPGVLARLASGGVRVVAGQFLGPRSIHTLGKRTLLANSSTGSLRHELSRLRLFFLHSSADCCCNSTLLSWTADAAKCAPIDDTANSPIDDTANSPIDDTAN